MKFFRITALTLFIGFNLLSCSEDEENSDCPGRESLENTTWIGNGDRNGEVITFISASNYSWSADYGDREGDYCFDGSSGNFDNTIRFVIVDNAITLNQEDQGGTGRFYKQ